MLAEGERTETASGPHKAARSRAEARQLIPKAKEPTPVGFPWTLSSCARATGSPLALRGGRSHQGGRRKPSRVPPTLQAADGRQQHTGQRMALGNIVQCWVWMHR